MPARSPEEICQLFKQAMAQGDIEAVLSVYDREVAFLNKDRKIVRGLDALRRQLEPMVAAKADFDFTIKQIVDAGDTALMHTYWTVSGPEPMHVHAIEVARRQSDGSWRWLIGDPFTIEREVAGRKAAGKE